MIFLTGASGFIGRNTLAELMAKYGEGQIKVLINKDKTILEAFPNIDYIEGSLGHLDSETLDLKGIHTLVHLAAKNIDTDNNGFEAVNVRGTQSICEAAKKAGVKRIILLSSTGVYGHCELENTLETKPAAADTPLSISKLKAEQIATSFASKDLQVVLLRPRFVYGNGDQYVIPRFITAAQKLPFWVRKGAAKLSFVYVKDLAKIITELSQPDLSLEQTQILHVNNGEIITIKNIIESISSLYGLERKRINLPFWPLYLLIRGRERLLGLDPESKEAGSLSSIRLKFITQHNHFSNKKLRQLFPNFKFHSFKEGLLASKDYYNSYL